MDDLINTLAGALLVYGGWGLVALLLILLLFFGDRMLVTGERFWALFRHISSFTFKRYTSCRLSNRIYHAAREVGRIHPDLLPYRVKIKWVRAEPVESFLKNGQVILKIQTDDDIHKSFVLAIAEFVRRGLIANIKRHLRNERLVQAIDLCTVDKILSQSYRESLAYFEREILNGLLAENDEFAKYFGQMCLIDRNGLFLPVLLNEMAKVFRRIDDQYFVEDFEPEVTDFLKFLQHFAGGGHKELRYEGRYIRVAFGLVANSHALRRRGRGAYLEQVERSLSEGAQTVYLLGRNGHAALAKQLGQTAARGDWRIRRVRIHEYRHIYEDHTAVQAVCVELSATEEDAAS